MKIIYNDIISIPGICRHKPIRGNIRPQKVSPAVGNNRKPRSNPYRANERTAVCGILPLLPCRMDRAAVHERQRLP